MPHVFFKGEWKWLPQINCNKQEQECQLPFLTSSALPTQLLRKKQPLRPPLTLAAPCLRGMILTRAWALLPYPWPSVENLFQFWGAGSPFLQSEGSSVLTMKPPAHDWGQPIATPQSAIMVRKWAVSRMFSETPCT